MQAIESRSSSRFSIPGAWMSGLLLASMLFLLTLSLREADWAMGMNLLTPVALSGLLVGVALSYSRWSGLFPVLQSLVMGAASVFYWISRAPDVPTSLDMPGRMIYIGNSLWKWGQLLFTDQPVRNNLVFVFELAILIWWLSYLAAWAVFREGRVWRAILPIGLALLVNTYFGPPKLGLYAALFVILALLLAVRTHLAEREIVWRAEHMRYADDIQLDFLRDGLIMAVFVVAMAALLPNAASNDALSGVMEPLRSPWRDVQQEWGRLFNSLNYQGVAVGDPVFGDTLTLGGPRDLGDQPIMDVRSASGRYWRASSYDTFTGRRWVNTSSLLQSVDAVHHVHVEDYRARREITQTITILAPTGNVLFAAGQPLRVSLKATASIAPLDPTSNDRVRPLAEIAMMHRREGALRPGDTYFAVSSLSRATVEDLQEAGTDYPQWALDRFLALPPDLSPQVTELARQVTAGAKTPYDQAAALENYLRGFTYNDQIAAPPPGVNAVNYFLLDVKQGYCDYYASSFAMMARSLGIPARVSAGYSQGEYQPDTGVFRVREYNGHAWPEVFFPGYGWVEFEPTAAERQIVRERRATPEENDIPSGRLSQEEDRFLQNRPEAPLPAPSTPQTPLAATSSENRQPLALLALLVLAVLTGLVLLLRRRGVARIGSSAPLAFDSQWTRDLFGRLLRWAQWLRLPVHPSQTPHEQAAVISGAAPEGRSAIESIANLYVEELYSPRQPDPAKAQQAWVAWNGLQPLLRRAWVRVRVTPKPKDV